MNQRACVLVVAGVDPGGGAGIAADVRAASVAGAFAAPVVATITVQSTSGLIRQRAVSPELVIAQAREVLAHQRVGAIKTGALGSASNVRAIARLAREHEALPLVVDPVRLPTRARARDARLLDAAGFDVLRRELVPRATIVTANADEASALSGVRVHDVASARRAAHAIVALGARAALVKGGHVQPRARTSVDVLAVGDRVVELAAPRLALPPLHGGGCVLASLVASRLAILAPANRRTRRQKLAGAEGAEDAEIERAVRWGRARHHALLARALSDVGGDSCVISP